MESRKRFSVVIYISGFFLFIVPFAYFINIFVSSKIYKLSDICIVWEKISEDPKKMLNSMYLNKSFGQVLLCTTVFYLLIILYFSIDKKNYLYGKEYGSSKLGNINKTKKYLQADKNEKYIVRYKEKLHKEIEVNTRNRILSKNLMMDIEGEGNHGLNSNIFVVGGSGAGKTHYLLRPMILQMSSSFIITDTKGELLKTMGGYLDHMGYKVFQLNLATPNGMRCSNRFNPLKYCKTETDILELVDILVENTTPPDSSRGEPIWENGDKLLLQALFFYSWLETREKNIKTVVELMKLAEVKEGPHGERIDSELDIIFRRLEEKNRTENLINGKVDKILSNEFEEVGELTHPAVVAYNSVMSGAADTVRSFISGVNTRLNSLRTPEILDLLSEDEFRIEEIGAGAGYDGKTKTAVFIVVSDRPKPYNFIAGIFYDKVISMLYEYADYKTDDGKLPVPVALMLDEFANIQLSKIFLQDLSTMRGRRISSVIIIQNYAQIKNKYKELWETIPGCCDTHIYLGGNEDSTFKLLSEKIGDGTFDKRSSSVTHSEHGSSSQSYDRYGRKLLTEDEIRKLPKNKCLVFIHGQDVIVDYKYLTNKHPMWKVSVKSRKNFDARVSREKTKKKTNMKLISQKKLEEYKQNKSENEFQKKVSCIEIEADDFLSLDFKNIKNKKMFDLNELMENRKRIQMEEQQLKKIEQYIIENTVDILALKKAGYTDEKIYCLIKLFDVGYDCHRIIELFSPDISMEDVHMYVDSIINMEKMKEKRK